MGNSGRDKKCFYAQKSSSGDFWCGGIFISLHLMKFLIPMNFSTHLKCMILTAAIAILAVVVASAQVHTSNTYRYLLTRGGTLKHLEYLTSEEVAGRGAGTAQAMRTAEYIAECLESYGVKPFRSVSFFQPFSLPAGKGGSQSYTQTYRQIAGSSSGVKIEKKGHNVVGYLPSGRKNARIPRRLRCFWICLQTSRSLILHRAVKTWRPCKKRCAFLA